MKRLEQAIYDSLVLAECTGNVSRTARSFYSSPRQVAEEALALGVVAPQGSRGRRADLAVPWTCHDEDGRPMEGSPAVSSSRHAFTMTAASLPASSTAPTILGGELGEAASMRPDTIYTTTMAARLPASSTAPTTSTVSSERPPAQWQRGCSLAVSSTAPTPP